MTPSRHIKLNSHETPNPNFLMDNIIPRTKGIRINLITKSMIRSGLFSVTPQLVESSLLLQLDQLYILVCLGRVDDIASSPLAALVLPYPVVEQGNWVVEGECVQGWGCFGVNTENLACVLLLVVKWIEESVC